MDTADTLPQQRDAPTDSGTSRDFDGSARDEPRESAVQAADDLASLCDRISGTQPRNRQLRTLEYYVAREHICLSVNQTAAVKLLDRNGYRTQLVISISCSDLQGPIRVNLAHTQDDANNHAIYRFRLNNDSFASGPYDWNMTLSFPVHGPMVGEEWWIKTVGIPPATGIATVDVTGYLYTD